MKFLDWLLGFMAQIGLVMFFMGLAGLILKHDRLYFGIGVAGGVASIALFALRGKLAADSKPS